MAEEPSRPHGVPGLVPGDPNLTRLDAGDGGGGDPACWLAQVCPACGAFNESPPGTPCWNCGDAPAMPAG